MFLSCSSLRAPPAAETIWSLSQMRAVCPSAWTSDSVYSFAKPDSSPMGEYFFKITSPSRSVKISSGRRC